MRKKEIKSLEEAKKIWKEQSLGQGLNLTGQHYNYLTFIYKTESINKQTKWVCKCDCGNYISVYVNNVKTNKTKSCGCLKEQKSKQNGRNNRNNLINQKFGKLQVIDYGHSDSHHVYWKCKCECGTIKEIRSDCLLLNIISSCGCDKNSHGEKVIKSLLLDNNIIFEEQKTFNNCYYSKSNYLCKFDFYLPKYNLLIEYDGIQHFEFVPYYHKNLENFNISIERDKFKNQWCKENNIPLIRIPYTHLNKITIQDLLLDSPYLMR